jgi:hypothetical protein
MGNDAHVRFAQQSAHLVRQMLCMRLHVGQIQDFNRHKSVLYIRSGFPRIFFSRNPVQRADGGTGFRRHSQPVARDFQKDNLRGTSAFDVASETVTDLVWQQCLGLMEPQAPQGRSHWQASASALR